MTTVVAGGELRAALLKAGERRLLIDSAGQFRAGEGLLERGGRPRGVLLERGLAHRRIGLWCWNSLAAVEAFMAVEWVGGTRVPVDPGAAVEEARAVFAAAGVEAVLCDGEHAGSIEGCLLHEDGTAL